MTSGVNTIITKTVLGLLLTIGIDNELVTFLANMRSKMVTINYTEYQYNVEGMKWEAPCGNQEGDECIS